jgi:hypothetical protein
MKAISTRAALLASIALAMPATVLLAQSERTPAQPTIAHAGVFPSIDDREFVAGGTRTVTTVVEGVAWSSPTSWLRISDGATRWNLMLPAPNTLIGLGMTRNSLPLESQITVVLTAEASGIPLTDGSLLGRVESITRTSDQSVVFNRATMPVAQP